MNETATGQGLAHAVGDQAIFGEAEVEEGGDGNGRGAQVRLLLDQVGAADEANGAFVAEGGQELEHGGGCILAGD